MQDRSSSAYDAVVDRLLNATIYRPPRSPQIRRDLNGRH